MFYICIYIYVERKNKYICRGGDLAFQILDLFSKKNSKIVELKATMFLCLLLCLPLYDLNVLSFY